MATIKIPPVLRGSVGGEKEVQASGGNVGEVLRELASQHPATESQLFSEDGELNRYVNVYLNDEDVRVLQGLETGVSDSDTSSSCRRWPAAAADRPARRDRRRGRLGRASGTTPRTRASSRCCRAGHAYPSRAARLLAGAGRGPGGHRCSMAEEDGELLGFTACGESRDADAGARGGRDAQHVRRRRPAGGAGVGQRARGRGARRPAQARVLRGRRVWSFAANERANAFYEACGFTRDGAERTEEGWADIPEVRYRRRV